MKKVFIITGEYSGDMHAVACYVAEHNFRCDGICGQWIVVVYFLVDLVNIHGIGRACHVGDIRGIVACGCLGVINMRNDAKIPD